MSTFIAVVGIEELTALHELLRDGEIEEAKSRINQMRGRHIVPVAILEDMTGSKAITRAMVCVDNTLPDTSIAAEPKLMLDIQKPHIENIANLFRRP